MMLTKSQKKWGVGNDNKRRVIQNDKTRSWKTFEKKANKL